MSEMTIDRTVWPEKLCDERRPSIAMPFRCDDWYCCTNGQLMVAVPFTGQAVAEYEPGTRFAREGLQKIESADGFLTFDVVAVREWCGEPERPCPTCAGKKRGSGDCDRCDGTGYIECECHCGDVHERECRDCHGTGGRCPECHNRGYVLPDDRPYYDRATIRGVEFNRRLLRAMTEGVPAGSFAMAANPDGPERPLLLKGSGWWGLLMPLRSMDGPPSPPYPAMEDLALPEPATP